MSSESFDVQGIRTLSQLLEQLPSGQAAATLAARLGVWTEAIHKAPASSTRTYPTDFARLGDEQLSTTNSYWISEAARATELVGLLEGQKVMLALAGKQAKAAARGRLRKLWDEPAEDGKVRKYTAVQLNDEAEFDPGVLDVELRTGLLEQSLASAKAYKEACGMVVAGISREISFRQAQMSARMR